MPFLGDMLVSWRIFFHVSFFAEASLSFSQRMNFAVGKSKLPGIQEEFSWEHVVKTWDLFWDSLRNTIVDGNQKSGNQLTS